MLQIHLRSSEGLHDAELPRWIAAGRNPDLVHAVESVNHGREDSSVFYIPGLPGCRRNFEYVRRQRERLRYPHWSGAAAAEVVCRCLLRVCGCGVGGSGGGVQSPSAPTHRHLERDPAVLAEFVLCAVYRSLGGLVWSGLVVVI